MLTVKIKRRGRWIGRDRLDLTDQLGCQLGRVDLVKNIEWLGMSYPGVTRHLLDQWYAANNWPPARQGTRQDWIDELLARRAPEARAEAARLVKLQADAGPRP